MIIEKGKILEARNIVNKQSCFKKNSNNKHPDYY